MYWTIRSNCMRMAFWYNKSSRGYPGESRRPVLPRPLPVAVPVHPSRHLLQPARALAHRCHPRHLNRLRCRHRPVFPSRPASARVSLRANRHRFRQVPQTRRARPIRPVQARVLRSQRAYPPHPARVRRVVPVLPSRPVVPCLVLSAHPIHPAPACRHRSARPKVPARQSAPRPASRRVPLPPAVSVRVRVLLPVCRPVPARRQAPVRAHRPQAMTYAW